jgi:hypothetical protein
MRFFICYSLVKVLNGAGQGLTLPLHHSRCDTGEGSDAYIALFPELTPPAARWSFAQQNLLSASRKAACNSGPASTRTRDLPLIRGML